MKRIIFFLFSILFAARVYCAENKLGITLGNPWVGARYNFSTKLNSELRYVIDPDLSIISLRGSHTFFSKNKLTASAGLEYGAISFKYEGVSGGGYLITPFIGSEYALGEKLGLGLDIGYSTISLKVEDVSVSGPEYIFNLYLSYYIL